MFVALYFAASPQAQEVSVGGQIRPRFEFRDPASGGYDTFTSMRVRAQVRAALDRKVRVFIQLQDVRLWGEEANTLGDFRADNFDLHQGYAELGDIGGRPLSLRLGRQEISLGGQRLVGAVGWTQQGRAFDGVRLSATPEGGRVDLLGIRLGDASASAVGISQNAYLLGAYVQLTRIENAVVESYALYNRVSGGADTDQVTLGIRLAGSRPSLGYRIEGSYQAGTRGGKDVAAYLLGGRIGTQFAEGKAQLTFWFDHVSGDDAPGDGKIKVFDTLFTTNHKFYGYADLFLNLPAHTGGLGLQDFAIKAQVTPVSEFTLALDVHSFFLAKDGGLSSRRLAEEADLTCTYRYSKQVSVVSGFSYVFTRDSLSRIGRLSEDLKFGYMLMNVAF